MVFCTKYIIAPNSSIVHNTLMPDFIYICIQYSISVPLIYCAWYILLGQEKNKCVSQSKHGQFTGKILILEIISKKMLTFNLCGNYTGLIRAFSMKKHTLYLHCFCQRIFFLEDGDVQVGEQETNFFFLGLNG